MELRLGSTTTNYYHAFIYGTYAGVTPSLAGGNNVGSWTYAGQIGSILGANIELQNPYASQVTFIQAFMPVGNGTYAGTLNGYLATSTSYTAFTLIANSGTMTGGTITVYGYRKA
jgi:hypothetical protein